MKVFIFRPGIFDWEGGGPNFGSERTVELFGSKLLLPHNPKDINYPWNLVTRKSTSTDKPEADGALI